MPLYKYNAYDSAGNVKKGVIEGISDQAVKEKLRSNELYIIDIHQIKNATVKNRSLKERNLTFYSSFFKRLSGLLNSGFSLVDSLKIISDSEINIKTKSFIQHLIEKIHEGSSFRNALLSSNLSIPASVINTISLGEASCGLASALDYLSSILAGRIENKRRLVNALLYPAFLVAASIIVTVFLLIIVVPMMQGVFSELNQELPVITNMIINVATFVRSNYMLLILLIVVLIVIFHYMLLRQKARVFFCKYMLKMPFAGMLLKYLQASSFATNMSLLMKSGISLEETLGLAGSLSGNPVVEEKCEQMRQLVIQGKNMTSEKSDIFPGGFNEAIRIGENSGRLIETFDEMALWCDRESKYYMNRMVSLIEPVSICIVGLMVGIIAFSIMYPLMQMNTLIK